MLLCLSHSLTLVCCCGNVCTFAPGCSSCAGRVGRTDRRGAEGEEHPLPRRHFHLHGQQPRSYRRYVIMTFFVNLLGCASLSSQTRPPASSRCSHTRKLIASSGLTSSALYHFCSSNYHPHILHTTAVTANCCSGVLVSCIVHLCSMLAS